MSVPSNLIPTRITQLPDAPIASEDGLLLYVYNGNTYKVRAGDLLSSSGVPPSRQVIAGTGLTGGGQLSENVTLSVAPKAIDIALLADTGTSTGTFGSAVLIPQITLNSAGQIVAVENVAISSSGSGTVTDVSVVSGNGFAGSVTNSTTTPAITISTTQTGLLKGDGTGISAATEGSDYSAGTSALATGILKSTTTTGELTIAVAGDFPTLNQNTTGTAASATSATNIDGGAAGNLPYQTGLGTTNFIANGTAGQVLISAGASAHAWGGITGGTF